MSEIILPWQRELPEGKVSGSIDNGTEDLELNRKNHVLLVDDSLRAITSLNRIFTGLGCDTILGFDGFTALNSLVNKEVDLMVLDMTMPKMDGDETLARADELLGELYQGQNTAEPKSIPVVVYTGMEKGSYRLHETKYFEVVDVWQKPISFSALSVRAEKIVDSIK